MGDRAHTEGKSRDGHSVGLSVAESDRGYAQGGGLRWNGFIQTFGELIRVLCLVVRIRP